MDKCCCKWLQDYPPPPCLSPLAPKKAPPTLWNQYFNNSNIKTTWSDVNLYGSLLFAWGKGEGIEPALTLPQWEVPLKLMYKPSTTWTPDYRYMPFWERAKIYYCFKYFIDSLSLVLLLKHCRYQIWFSGQIQPTELCYLAQCCPRNQEFGGGASGGLHPSHHQISGPHHKLDPECTVTSSGLQVRHLVAGQVAAPTAPGAKTIPSSVGSPIRQTTWTYVPVLAHGSAILLI